MAKRYYLSRRVGSGTEMDPFRDYLSDLGENYSAQMDETGATDRSIAIVGTPSHTELLKDPNLFGMPDFPLDGKLSSMRNPTLNAMNTRLAERGFGVSWGSSDAYRDVLRSLGKQLNPNFDENGFDVADR